VVYGFFDIRYSSFKDFIYSKAEILEYIKSMKPSARHNPLASITMILIFVFIFLTIFSGGIFFGIEEGRGIFGFLNSSFYPLSHTFKEIHEFSANSLMVLIFIHLAGVFIDKFIHKNNSIKSMISGEKDIKDIDIEEKIAHKIFGFISIIAILSISIYYITADKNSIFLKSIFPPIDYEVEHKSFAIECSSCHTLYPPFLLPKSAWYSMMDNLDNHFGDDASLDMVETLSIKEYLAKHSAENSTRKASVRILKSYKGELAITKNSYWERKHKKIKDETFAQESIKRKSNCKACHQDIESGIIGEAKIPKRDSK
jgi:cytochrome b